MSVRRVPRSAVALVLLLVAMSLATALSANMADANANATDATTNTTLSACALCRDRGQCDRAYRGGTGVFCATTPPSLGEAACCCASSDVCPRLTNGSTDCACLAPPASSVSPSEAASSPRPSTGGAPSRIGIFSSHKIAWTLVAMAVLGALFAMYLYTTRLDRTYHYREPPARRAPGSYQPPPLTVDPNAAATASSKSSHSS